MSRYHGALIQVSLGYSPDRGRFHTRSAPVRRSQGCKHPLPLDLHVLGLPLAFILSQDQTLHCISLNVCPTPGNIRAPASKWFLFSLRCRYNMYMNFFLFFPKKKSASSTNPPLENALPHQLSGCKYKNVIPTPQNVFGYFFKKFTPH